VKRASRALVSTLGLRAVSATPSPAGRRTRRGRRRRAPRTDTAATVRRARMSTSTGRACRERRPPVRAPHALRSAGAVPSRAARPNWTAHRSRRRASRRRPRPWARRRRPGGRRDPPRRRRRRTPPLPGSIDRARGALVPVRGRDPAGRRAVASPLPHRATAARADQMPGMWVCRDVNTRPSSRTKIRRSPTVSMWNGANGESDSSDGRHTSVG